MAAQKDVEKIVNKYMRTITVPTSLRPLTRQLVENMMSHPCYANPDYKWQLNDFELGKRLGRGKFGRVYVGREKKTGFIVAIKTLDKKEISNSRVERQVMREIEIQSHLKHPNVLQMLTWFHDDFRIYLVLEYAGKGELYTHLKKSPGGRFGEHLSAKYTYQVADALNYCHQQKVIHRDIKPENLLLTITDDVKVADFGWSVHSPSLRRDTMCGTLDYLCPEMVESQDYDHTVDNWCLGVLCYEFLVGRPPFEDENAHETYKNITSIRVHYPSHVPFGAVDLIKKLLTYNSRQRLSLPEVMKHKWIVDNK